MVGRVVSVKVAVISEVQALPSPETFVKEAFQRFTHPSDAEKFSTLSSSAKYNDFSLNASVDRGILILRVRSHLKITLSVSAYVPSRSLRLLGLFPPSTALKIFSLTQVCRLIIISEQFSSIANYAPLCSVKQLSVDAIFFGDRKTFSLQCL